MGSVFVCLKFFCHGQQQNTNDYNADEYVSFPVELFLQENTGQQQGNNTDRGEDRSGNGILTTQGINVGKLTGGLENSCQDLVLMLGDWTELDLLGLHEDE